MLCDEIALIIARDHSFGDDRRHQRRFSGTGCSFRAGQSRGAAQPGGVKDLVAQTRSRGGSGGRAGSRKFLREATASFDIVSPSARGDSREIFVKSVSAIPRRDGRPEREAV